MEIIAAVGAEIISRRSEVVVDHVEDDGETALMRCVDQHAQVVRPAVGARRRVEQDAVVAPIARPRKIGHWHDLDRVDAELDQMIELLDRRAKSSLRRECADMQLINNQLAKWWAPPAIVLPCIAAGIDHLRWPMHALRIEA